MKIGGVDPTTLPNEEVLVLPRGPHNIVFRAKGLPDMEDFNRQVPEPKAPGKLTASGIVPDLESPNYLGDMAEYNKRRLGYLVVFSLAPSNIEWDTVKLDRPGTWANWEQDLKNSNLSQVECNLVLNLVMEANSLDETKLRKARENFLRGPGAVSAK
jgi:hypothetical protein